MQKRLILIYLAALLAFCIGARADNVVKIGSATGTPGDTVAISVVMENSDAVSALQLQVPMPGNCSLVAGSAATSARAAAHSATAGVRNDTLNLLVYSQGMAAISGTSGEVLTFKLKLGTQPLTMTLAAARVILTDTLGNKLSGTAESGTVTVATAKADYAQRTIDFGRVPIRGNYTQQLTINNIGNAELVVSALEFSAEELSSDVELPFSIEAGGSRTITLKYAPTVRGKISETVRVVCNSISKLNTITLVANPYAVNELHIDDASGIADSTVTIHLQMNNMDAISGFQFEFALPEQFKYVDGSFKLSDRKVDHQGLATLHGDTLRLMAYSLNDNTFTGNDGEVASFDIKLSGRWGASLEAYKAVLTANVDGVLQDVMSDKYGCYVNISSPIISAASNIDMGATPVTEDAVSTLQVSNNGSAPLTINRVLFDTLQFSVKEAIPVTIEAGGSQTLTVVYQGQAQRSYDAMMQLYCNDPNQRLWNVSLTGSRFAPNYISAAAPDIYAGDTLKVSVALSNYDPINGLQFDVSYPEEYFTPVAAIVGTSRTEGLSLQTRNMGQGVNRYFVYSLSDASVSPDDGEFFTISFSPKADPPTGEYELKFTSIKLGTPDMTDKYAGTDLTTSFKVNPLLLGDVNCDGVVNIADATAITSHTIGNTPSVFNKRAADVNSDNIINIADATKIKSGVIGNNE